MFFMYKYYLFCFWRSQPEDKDAENGLEAGEEMDNLFDLPDINNLSEPEYSKTDSIYDV